MAEVDAGTVSDVDAANQPPRSDATAPSDGGAAQPGRPEGIYVLDSAQGADGGVRNANLRAASYPFVTGYTTRRSWSDFESSEGSYDFSSLDALVAELPPGKKLTLLLGGNASLEPSYVAASASATYSSTSPAGGMVTRAVPWDSSLLIRYKAFAKALGDHMVRDSSAGGAAVPFRSHSALANVNLSIPGLGEIRDRDVRIKDIPGYTRASFVAAVKATLESETLEFPRQVVYTGMWAVGDDVSAPTELWQDLLDTITTEFDGLKRPRVGLFEENLAASKDASGQVTGLPTPSYAAPLFKSKGQTFTLFQALEGWNSPFANPDKVAGATPADGLAYARDTFGAAYVELYVPDIEDQSFWPSYDAFNKSIGK